MINIEVLTAQNKALKERVDRLLQTINERERAHDEYVREVEASLRSNQDLIFAMFDKFGPVIDITIPKFADYMANAQITGGMGIDESGTLSVNITFSLNGNSEPEKQ